MNKTEILKFFDNQPIVILSTVDAGGAPHARALVNPRNENITPDAKMRDLFRAGDKILLFTNTHSDKITHMRQNSAAALYAYDMTFSGMELTGNIVEITDGMRKKIWDATISNEHFAVCYPDGFDDFSLIEFIPKKFKTYTGATVTKTSGDVK